MERKNWPDFFIVGAQKSATTSLQYYLAQHPDLFLNKIKELNYFSDYYDKGNEWYKAFFAPAKKNQYLGDISPRYMIYASEVAPRIYKLNPTAKIVFCLRNPIDRAYSMYNFDIQRGKYPHLWKNSFETILNNRIGFEYLENGKYIEQIKFFKKCFSNNQMHYMLFEDFKKNVKSELDKLFRFLGVSSVNINLKPSGTTRVLRSLALSGIRRKLQDYKLAQNVGALEDYGLLYKIPEKYKKIIRKLIYKNTSYPPMKTETRQKLQDYYRNYNQELSTIICKDLSLWEE